MENWHHPADVPFVLRNEIRVCLDRPGEVEITGVEFRDTFGDISVKDFGVVDIRDYAGLDTPIGHPLAAHGFESGSAVVEVACPLETYPHTAEIVPNAALGIEISKPDGARAGGRDLVISYETPAGGRGALVWPMEFVLCGEDEGEGECPYIE
jgi:hypothetical protein